MIIFDNDGKPLGQRSGAEREVQKARPIHSDIFAQILDLKRRLDLLCEGAWVGLQLLR